MSGKGDIAGQKQRGRERAKGQESVTGIRPTQSGSSGHTLFMTRIAKRTFADIKADAVHACDVVSVIDGIRKTPSGSLVVSITSPANHQRELFDLMDKSARGLVWIRVYLVPQHPLVADDP